MVRPARLEDFKAIDKIREVLTIDVSRLSDVEYRANVQRNGFLLPIAISYKKFVRNPSLYLVTEDENGVAGYMRFEDKQDLKRKDKITWIKPELEEVYFNGPHAYIAKLGVKPTSRKRGMATELLEYAENQARQNSAPYIFSFVTLSPVTNFPSMMFHEKNGFERLAVLKPTTAYGLEGYQNILYGKKL